MRRFRPLALIAAVLATAAVPALAAPAPPTGKVQTTTEANQESLQGAAKAPLRDLNVVRTDVPDVLVRALNDPYARPDPKKKCLDLIALIAPLNDALGPDLDEPLTADEQSLVDRGRPMALGAVAGVASDVIPFRSVVRRVTGAQKHDDYVQSAINAGNVRRAYLKGLGEARGCKMPAAPLHVATGRVIDPPPVAEGMKPRYPVR